MSMQEIISELFIGEENETIENPYSGDSINLNPTEVAVYDYLKGCEMLGNVKHLRMCIDWFVENNPKAYSVLLD